MRKTGVMRVVAAVFCVAAAANVFAVCSVGVAAFTDAAPMFTNDPLGLYAGGACAQARYYMFTVGATSNVYSDSQTNTGGGGIGWGPQNLSGRTAACTNTNNQIVDTAALQTRVIAAGWTVDGINPPATNMNPGCPCSDGTTATCAGDFITMFTNEAGPNTTPGKFAIYDHAWSGVTLTYNSNNINTLYTTAGSSVLGAQPYVPTAVQMAIPDLKGAGNSVSLTPATSTASFTFVANPTWGPAASAYRIQAYRVYELIENDTNATFNGNYDASGWTSLGTIAATAGNCPGGICTGSVTYTKPVGSQEAYFALGVDIAAPGCPVARCPSAGVLTMTRVGSQSFNVKPTGIDAGFANSSANYDNLQSVTISFDTTDETGVAGFNVYRGTGSAPVSYTKLTSTAIASHGTPSSYSFTDTTLPRQRTYGTYTYKIEAVGPSGAAMFNIMIPVQK